jgi:hypothetical protein
MNGWLQLEAEVRISQCDDVDQMLLERAVLPVVLLHSAANSGLIGL